MKKALITGVAGQDGSYLAEFLLDKGYEVHGIVRRTSLTQRSRIDHLHTDERFKDRFILHYGDLNDSGNLTNLLLKIKPDEVYNLAYMTLQISRCHPMPDTASHFWQTQLGLLSHKTLQWK